jgi:hypothetical protein
LFFEPGGERIVRPFVVAQDCRSPEGENNYSSDEATVRPPSLTGRHVGAVDPLTLAFGLVLSELIARLPTLPEPRPFAPLGLVVLEAEPSESSSGLLEMRPLLLAHAASFDARVDVVSMAM